MAFLISPLPLSLVWAYHSPTNPKTARFAFLVPLGVYSTPDHSEQMDSLTLDLDRIATEFRLQKSQIENVVSLLDEGNTIPFITRYRKERTGGLDEEVLRRLQTRVTDLRALNDRKTTILKSIDLQGKLTDTLKAQILAAGSMKRLEDLYLPFKPKKKTRASDAREKGLEPLATAIWTADPVVADLPTFVQGMIAPEKGLNTIEEILQGASDILAEDFSEMVDVRAGVRNSIWATGMMVSVRATGEKPAPVEGTEETPAPTTPTPKKGKKDEKGPHEFRDYFNFKEGLKEIPPHRILALNRGEKESVLKVSIVWDEQTVAAAARTGLKTLDGHPHRQFVELALEDGLKRLLYPSLDTEIRKELKDEALQYAVEIFARNLRSLLLQPPLRGKRVLAVDPGIRTGCKIAALDEQGVLLEDTVIYPHEPKNEIAEAKATLAGLIRKHQLTMIAIGNGTACRETETLVSDLIADLEKGADGQFPLTNLVYIVVNEAGASDYSASPIAKEEFPDKEATVRGTVSIGRRLQDPLAELVKIDPQHVGVGLYQHDVKANQLKSSLDQVVESCVNEVGVELNTASAPLLRYVAGLNAAVASDIVKYRQENGPFQTRDDIKKVKGIGEARFVQAAGFLRLPKGNEPLDNTSVHPESYDLARKILTEISVQPSDLLNPEAISGIKEKLGALNAEEVATRLGAGVPTVRDILEALGKPGRDPRDDRPAPIFKKGILKLEDLVEGMQLRGTVLNVVPFGAFVDIGLKETGLVHISRLANRYLRSPHEVVSVGDVVTVWVVGVDKELNRATLTMLEPGTEQKPEPRGERPPRGQRPPRGEGRPPRGDRPPRQPREGAPVGEGQPQGDRPPQGERPPRPPRGDRGPRPPRGDRPPQGERPPQEGRPQGERPQGERSEGGRPPRPPGTGGGGRPSGGDRGRPQGERGSRGPSRPNPNWRSGKKPEAPKPPVEETPAAETPTEPTKPKPPKKLKKGLPSLDQSAIKGERPLNSFDELAAFFKQRDEPKPPKEGE